MELMRMLDISMSSDEVVGLEKQPPKGEEKDGGKEETLSSSDSEEGSGNAKEGVEGDRKGKEKETEAEHEGREGNNVKQGMTDSNWDEGAQRLLRSQRRATRKTVSTHSPPSQCQQNPNLNAGQKTLCCRRCG